MKPFLPVDAERARLFALMKPEDTVPVPMTAAERRQPGLRGAALTEAFRQFALEKDYTLDDLKPQRLLQVWRLAREWASLMGYYSEPGQTLQEALAGEPHPWEDRKALPLESHGHDEPFIELVREAGGLSMAPPRPPKSADKDPRTYDPFRDRKLVMWTEAVRHVLLGRLAASTSLEGRLGSAGLIDPVFARLAMPTFFEVQAQELKLVREALEELAGGGRQAVEKRLSEKYHLLPRETSHIVALAMRAASDHANEDEDSAKGLMLMRLERIMEQCQESFDPRGAIAAVREMARIRGIVSEDGSRRNADAREMAREVQVIQRRAEPAEKISLPPPPEM